MPFFCVLSSWVATLSYYLLSGLSVICSRLFCQVCLCCVNCTVCIVRCLHLCACITHYLQIVRLYSITLFVVLTVPLLRYYFWHKSLSDCVLVGMKNCICVSMIKIYPFRNEKLYRRIYDQNMSAKIISKGSRICAYMEYLNCTQKKILLHTPMEKYQEGWRICVFRIC